MDLRNYLETLAVGNQAGENFAKSAQELRQQAALQQFAAQVPQLAQNQDVGGIVSGALSYGNQTPLNELLKNAMNPTKNKAPYTEQQLVAQGLEADKAKVIKDLPFDQQKDAIDNIAATKSRGISERGVAVSEENAARNLREETQKQRNLVAKNFKEVETKFRDEDRAISKIGEAFNQKTLPSDAVVMNYIARNIAGEKGPLSEGDIKRIVGDSFYGDLTAAENWIKGATSSKATPEQRAAYKQLLDIAKTNFDTYRQQAVYDTFQQALEDNPKLKANGKLDNQIILKADRLGYDAKLDKDGYLDLAKKEKKTAPLDVTNKETGAPDINKLEAQINLISNKDIKAKALSKLNEAKASGNANPEALNAFYEKLKQFLPK